MPAWICKHCALSFFLYGFRIIIIIVILLLFFFIYKYKQFNNRNKNSYSISNGTSISKKWNENIKKWDEKKARISFVGFSLRIYIYRRNILFIIYSTLNEINEYVGVSVLISNVIIACRERRRKRREKTSAI